MQAVQEGEILRDEGMAAAIGGGNEAYKALFIATLRELALSGVLFTSETITDKIGMPPYIDPTSQNRGNLVGALMGGASRKKMIVFVRAVKSTHPITHAARIAQWKGDDTWRRSQGVIIEEEHAHD